MQISFNNNFKALKNLVKRGFTKLEHALNTTMSSSEALLSDSQQGIGFLNSSSANASSLNAIHQFENMKLIRKGLKNITGLVELKEMK